jgi:hypothetical protein
MFSWRRQELAHLDLSRECRKSAGLGCIASGALAVSRWGLSSDRGWQMIEIIEDDRRCVDLSAGGLGVGSSNLPAPTNKIRHLLQTCVTQMTFCVTLAPAR